jgi:hypothetical protein
MFASEEGIEVKFQRYLHDKNIIFGFIYRNNIISNYYYYYYYDRYYYYCYYRLKG